jgi:hypothetical protein
MGVGRAVSPLACGNVVVAAPETPTAAPARDMAKIVTDFISKKVESQLDWVVLLFGWQFCCVVRVEEKLRVVTILIVLFSRCQCFSFENSVKFHWREIGLRLFRAMRNVTKSDHHCCLPNGVRILGGGTIDLTLCGRKVWGIPMGFESRSRVQGFIVGLLPTLEYAEATSMFRVHAWAGGSQVVCVCTWVPT